MKQVLGLIYFPSSLSRSVARVREFRRCPEHDNVLAYEGRALSIDEFNRLAPRLLGDGAKGQYGVQPIAKIVEVEIVEDLQPGQNIPPVEAVPPVVSVPVVDLPKVTLEPAGDGFVLVNYEGDEARYMGVSQVWESDVSLVLPFASEEEAREASPGMIVKSLEEHSGASDSPLVEDSGAPASMEPEAPTSPDNPPPEENPNREVKVNPKNIRETVMKTQQAKRVAKAARNAPPKKVTPPVPPAQ